MGSMGATGSSVAFAAFLMGASACAPRTPPQVAAPASPVPPATAVTVAASDDLPDGPGRRILTSACVACHSLREVTKFRGFYARPQWRDIVLTMVDYGAPLGEKDVEVLTDYLTAQLGKQ